MTPTDPRPDRERHAPGDAPLEALLTEAFHGPGQADLTAAVLTGLARDGGAAAAARLAAAERNGADATTSSPSPTPPPRRALLVAAVVLLGAAAVLGVALWPEAGERPVAPLQDPRPERPDDDPAQGPGELVAVRDLAHLRELAAEATALDVEVLQLGRLDLPRIELGGVPVRAAAEDLQQLRLGLRSARRGREGEWDHQNVLRLRLPSGGYARLAIYTYGPDNPALRLHAYGLPYDCHFGGPHAIRVRELLDTATTVARIAHGVVLEADELSGPGAFPANLEELQLFGLDDEALQQLGRFAQLRVLDASGLDGLGPVGVRHIAACEGLEQLALRGTALTDDDLVPLAGLPRLRRLDLSRAGHLTGALFDRFAPGLPGRTGLAELDLSRVTTWTTAGLEAAARAAPGILRLSRCDLDDADLRALATGGRRIRELSLRGNDRITVAGLDVLVQGLGRLEMLDVRGADGLDAEALARLAAEHRALRIVR